MLESRQQGVLHFSTYEWGREVLHVLFLHQQLIQFIGHSRVSQAGYFPLLTAPHVSGHLPPRDEAAGCEARQKHAPSSGEKEVCLEQETFSHVICNQK